VFAGITMVSNIPFYSFKEVNWRRRVPLWVILASVLGIAVVASRPSLVLFALFMSYALSGYVMWAGKGACARYFPKSDLFCYSPSYASGHAS